MKVFIGVGHGGSDPGAVASTLYEKNINLTVALAMQEELEKYQIQVEMSRYIDEDDRLEEEIQEANAYKPDLAVEVHTNAGGGHGFEIYRQTSINYGEQSLRLAENIYDSVCWETKAPVRKPAIRTKLMSNGSDWFGWLREVQAPAVLCEGFFLDSATDRLYYDSPEKLQALGVAYARGVLKYLGIKYNPDTGVTGDKIYKIQAGAFGTLSNAVDYVDRLSECGFPAFIIEEVVNNDKK